MKNCTYYPIHKKGPNYYASIDRPISITSTVFNYLSKVMEKIIANQLHKYLVEHNILTPAQFGFQHGHSTIL